MRLEQLRGAEKPLRPFRKRQRLPALRMTATRTRLTLPAPLTPQPRLRAVPLRTRRLREARTQRFLAKAATGAVRSAHALDAFATAGATPVTCWIRPARRGTPKPVT